MEMASVRWVKHHLQATFSSVKISTHMKHRTYRQVRYVYIFHIPNHSSIAAAVYSF
jgi:hypothetical protein